MSKAAERRRGTCGTYSDMANDGWQWQLIVDHSSVSKKSRFQKFLNGGWHRTGASRITASWKTLDYDFETGADSGLDRAPFDLLPAFR